MAVRTVGDGTRAPVRYQIVEFDVTGGQPAILSDGPTVKSMPRSTASRRYVFYWESDCSGRDEQCRYNLVRLDRVTGQASLFGGQRNFRLIGRIVPVGDDSAIVAAEFPALGYRSIQDYADHAAGNALWRIGRTDRNGPLVRAVEAAEAEHPAVAGNALFYDGRAPGQGISIIRADLSTGMTSRAWTIPASVTFQPTGGNILALDADPTGSSVVLYSVRGGPSVIDEPGKIFRLDVQSGRWSELGEPNPAKLRSIKVTFPQQELNSTGARNG